MGSTPNISFMAKRLMELNGSNNILIFALFWDAKWQPGQWYISSGKIVKISVFKKSVL